MIVTASLAAAGTVTFKLINRCSRRDTPMSMESASEVDEEELVINEEVQEMMKLKQEELKTQCRLRGLTVGGNKRDLATRLLNYESTPDKPTAKQLATVARLEQKLGLKPSPKSLTSKAEASKRIQSLSSTIRKDPRTGQAKGS